MNESQKNNQKYIEELEKFEETRKNGLKRSKMGTGKSGYPRTGFRFKRTGGAV